LKQTGADYSSSIGNAAMQKVAAKAARIQQKKRTDLSRAGYGEYCAPHS
jgi:hypothetical protein